MASSKKSFWDKNHNAEDYEKIIDTEEGVRGFAAKAADTDKVTWNYSEAWNAGLDHAAKIYLDEIKARGEYPTSPQDKWKSKWYKLVDMPSDTNLNMYEVLCGMIPSSYKISNGYSADEDWSKIIENIYTGIDVEDTVKKAIDAAEKAIAKHAIFHPFLGINSMHKSTNTAVQYHLSKIYSQKSGKTVDFTLGSDRFFKLLEQVAGAFIATTILYIGVVLKNATAKQICAKYLAAKGLTLDEIKSLVSLVSQTKAITSTIAERISKL